MEPDCDSAFERAEHALYGWRLDEAQRELAAISCLELRAPVLELRARIAELRGELDEADRLDREAHALEPLEFPERAHLDPAAFDAVVLESIHALPTAFRELLEDSEVVVAPVPSPELVIEGQEVETPPDLLGLFSGPSQLERAEDVGAEPTPIVYLFQRNLERACADTEELVEQIRITLYHELGHLLGFDEEGVDELGLA